MKKNILLFVLLTTFNVFSQDNIPNVDLKTMEGKTISFHEVTDQNNVVIISLWATWCVPCIKELDAISDVYEEWQEETGVELIAVSVDDSRTVKRVKSLINGKGWDYQILLDTNNDLKEFGVDSEAPDLFNSEKDFSSSEESILSDPIEEEDDLEIPAFLRRQKN